MAVRTGAYQFRDVSVGGDFAFGDFLDGGVDRVEECLGFGGAGHFC